MPNLAICNHVVRFEIFLTSPSEVDIRKTSLHSMSVCHPANVAANCKLAEDLDIPCVCLPAVFSWCENHVIGVH